MAAAEIIQTYHKETVGIDHLAGTNTGIPPARTLVLHAVVARRMMVTGQGMADQHRVGRVVSVYSWRSSEARQEFQSVGLVALISATVST